MKLISLSALSFLLCVSLLSAHPSAHPRERKGATKITKNEAQHIALKRYPGARVTAARLEKMQGKSVWLIEVARPKAKGVTEVAVDAMSGRIASGKRGWQ